MIFSIQIFFNLKNCVYGNFDPGLTTSDQRVSFLYVKGQAVLCLIVQIHDEDSIQKSMGKDRQVCTNTVFHDIYQI
jgi:hypothetical protein